MGSLESQYGKLQQGQHFASLKLADEFVEHKKLPNIHKLMGVMMDRIAPEERKGALDLGACHGLLSIRAAQMGFGPVRGVDIDPRSVEIFDQHIRQHVPQDVTLEAKKIDLLSPEFEDWFAQTVRTYNVTTLLARRIMPELCSDTYGKDGLKDEVWIGAGGRLGKAAHDAGIKYVILEGRLWKGRKSHANPLFKVDNEVYAFCSNSNWRVADREKEAVLLVRA